MKWENFTADRVAGFKCKPGKQQSIFWDGKTPGLGLRVTAAGAKSYIFQTELHGKTIRITIGDSRAWSIGKAQAEASRLKVMTDQSISPREVEAAAQAAKEAEATAQREQEARELVTVAEAWQVYVAERSAAKIDGKPVWGDRHKAHHAYFVQAGGVKRKRGTRPGESKKTRPGVLVPLMTMRLADLDAKAIASWLDKETKQAPTPPHREGLRSRAFNTSRHWPPLHFPRYPCMACAVALAHYLSGWKYLLVSLRRLWDTSQVQ